MFNRKSKSKPAPAETALVIDDEPMPAAKPPKKKGGSPLGLVTLLLLVVGVGVGGYFIYTRFLSGGGSGGETPLTLDQPVAQEQSPALEQAPLPDDQPTVDAPLASLSDATSETPDAAATKAAKKQKNKANKANQQEQTAGATDNANSDPNAAAANPPPAAVNAAAPNSAALALLDSTPGCGGHPGFLDKLGLADAQFSTNVPGTRGLFVSGTGTQNGGAPIKYQHQSWSGAGYLDAFVVDSQGNVYIAPSPRTGPGVPEPSNQDQIFRLASTTGLLTPLIELPAAAPASPENQYGVLGLALDCANNILYATSIAGSTPGNPVGRIYIIDTASGQVIGQQDNINGYGVAVRSTESGKQLYFGSVDDPQIRAIDLDAAGNFQGEPRTVATLADPQRARRILFTDNGEMVVQQVEFNFQNGDIPQGSPVLFTYDAVTDAWTPAQ